MVGLKISRSAQDERLVECIFTSHLFQDTAYSESSLVYGATATNLIIDARPTTNAMANVAMGAGTENMDNYKTGKKAYLGIDNIHVMRNSLKMVDEAIRLSEETSIPLDRGLLRKSNWLKHISTLLDGAVVIVKNVHLNASHVLIHCSDGWDRTSQLSAIAQICLDPYFRTIDGFKVLVEKDWLAFGHRFLDRSGHLSSEKLFTVADIPDEDSEDEFGGAQKVAQAFFSSMQKQFASNHHLKETSPVFHQFLDCVHQIQRQQPDRFEFNEDFLIEMHTQLYACQYGTFLFNNEYDRQDFEGKTVSVWDANDRERFVNPAYDPSLDDRGARDADQGVLIPNAKDVRFWHRLFKRGDDEMNGSNVQLEGAEVLGPVGTGRVDPLVETSPRVEKKTQWSFASGAISALQGAAREIRSIGQEAMNQIRAETGEVEGEMWSRTDRETSESIRPSSDHNPWAYRPAEINPWAEDELGSTLARSGSKTVPTASSYQATALPFQPAAQPTQPIAELTAKTVSKESWDPLGAL